MSAASLMLISLLAVLLIAVAACGDDDDGSQTGTGSPTSAPDATEGPSPTGDAGGNGNGNGGNGSGGNGSGQGTPAPTSSGDESPPPGITNSGTATIAGIQYDFTVDGCSISPDAVVVIGVGQASDGRPFIATATWYEEDFFGGTNSLELGIATNISGLLEIPDEVFKAGKSDSSSTLDSLDLDLTAFSVEAAGRFFDRRAPQDPPVDGTFSLSCS